MPQTNDRAAWLQGPPAACSLLPLDRKEFESAAPSRTYRLILLGAPGVGKGTQAELLSQSLHACHLSTGDIFRAAKSACANGIEPSPAMKDALQYMRRGDLVPDTTVLAIIRERKPCLRCAGGFILDGFPRTVAQAKTLQNLLGEQTISLDAVLDYRLPTQEIVARLSGRRTCAACKAVFHTMTRPPKKPSICDHCGGTLIQREDDRAEAIRVRLEAYTSQTSPLTDFYSKLKLLIPIDADGSPETILQRTLEALKARA